MCGIAGIFRYRSAAPVAAEVILAMADTMAHRGPDDRGVYCRGPVGLGHRRLSIIDLAGGHQPLANEDGSRWIVYNGEVYNHRDLRRDLERAGHSYRTCSDSETILHAYEEWGPQCVERLRGMFAFAIWEEPRRRLFIARDRFGVKPLYYADGGESLIFGSEIKALLASGEVEPRLRRDKIVEQLALGYLAGDETLLAGVRKLPAGYTLTVDADRCELRRYWDLPTPAPAGNRSDDELCEDFRELLEQAVTLRLMSDVPLGAFLSGGVDSSAVVALMARQMPERVKTFSVGYDDRRASELSYARAAAEHLGTEHREIVMSAADLRRELERLIWHEDKPIAFPSSVALYFCARLAQENVKVVLTGEGSDELLAGYDRYGITPWNLRLGRLYERALPAPLRALIREAVLRGPGADGLRRKLGRTFLAAPADLEHLYVANFLSCFHGRSLANVLRPEVTAEFGGQSPYRATLDYLKGNGRDELAAMQYLDIKTYLEELLMKQDRMSMAASVESRVPFLDHHLAEFAAGLPRALKLRGLSGKRILKRAMRGVLPERIIRRKKMGFPVPLARWLREELAPWYREVLLDDSVRREGLFNVPRLEAMIQEHVEHRADWSDQLWRVLNFHLWQSALPELAADRKHGRQCHSEAKPKNLEAGARFLLR